MTSALIAFAMLFILLFPGQPIGIGMGLVGTIGFAMMIRFDPARPSRGLLPLSGT
tara:strand:+ start:795 stop:959 length:165 start_codon:yes stop_codon:yes gene_type:complete